MRYLVVALCISSIAQAQGLDAERFTPATGAEGSFALEHPSVPRHLGWGLGLFLNFADDPVVERDIVDDSIISKPLDTAFTADVVGSIGLWGRLELGVGLPVHLVYEGDPYGNLEANAGIGDLRFVPKVSIVRAGNLDHHFLLSLAVPTSFPTGDAEALRGGDGFSVAPTLLLAGYVGGLGIGFDVGYRWRSEHPANLPWGDAVTLGPWLTYNVTDALVLRAEGIAEKIVSSDVDGADFPFELLGGLSYAIGRAQLYAGASAGLSDGIGDPDFRIIGGIRLRAGVPARQGFRDSDGDGILDKDDECADEAEDVDTFRDDDGCPEPDNDGDGIPDGDDECPELSGEPDRNGCPAKTYVKIENNTIYIFGKVQFRTGSSEIQSSSNELLDQISEAMKANPNVSKVRIEGHTDNTGDPEVNRKLSQTRAEAVKAALVKRGVDSDRLDTRGMGQERPIAPNSSPGGRQKNRRVEFVIVEGNR